LCHRPVKELEESLKLEDSDCKAGSSSQAQTSWSARGGGSEPQRRQCKYHFPLTSAGSSLLERVVEEIGRPDGQRFWPVFVCICRAVTEGARCGSWRVCGATEPIKKDWWSGTRRSLLLLNWIGGIPTALESFD
ncbi:hypothetical protein XENOCAPTIV_022350, partial [Xenoophorus captivus]